MSIESIRSGLDQIAEKVSDLPASQSGEEMAAYISAHNTDETAHADIREIANAALPKAGGVMEGSLWMGDHSIMFGEDDEEGFHIVKDSAHTLGFYGLNGDERVALSNIADPTDNSHAANKRYVDAKDTLVVTGSVSDTTITNISSSFAEIAERAARGDDVKLSLNVSGMRIALWLHSLDVSVALFTGVLQSSSFTAAVFEDGTSTVGELTSIDSLHLAGLNRTNSVHLANTNYTTLMARGTSLHAADTTPAVNGAICWTYK